MRQNCTLPHGGDLAEGLLQQECATLRPGSFTWFVANDTWHAWKAVHNAVCFGPLQGTHDETYAFHNGVGCQKNANWCYCINSVILPCNNGLILCSPCSTSTACSGCIGPCGKIKISLVRNNKKSFSVPCLNPGILPSPMLAMYSFSGCTGPFDTNKKGKWPQRWWVSFDVAKNVGSSVAPVGQVELFRDVWPVWQFQNQMWAARVKSFISRWQNRRILSSPCWRSTAFSGCIGPFGSFPKELSPKAWKSVHLPSSNRRILSRPTQLKKLQHAWYLAECFRRPNMTSTYAYHCNSE